MPTSEIRNTFHECLFIEDKYTTETQLEPERGNVSMTTLKFHM
jgi:hypothetical protein